MQLSTSQYQGQHCLCWSPDGSKRVGDHIKEVSGRYEGDTGGEEGGQHGCGVVCSHHVAGTHTGVHVYTN